MGRRRGDNRWGRRGWGLVRYKTNPLSIVQIGEVVFWLFSFGGHFLFQSNNVQDRSRMEHKQVTQTVFQGKTLGLNVERNSTV